MSVSIEKVPMPMGSGAGNKSKWPWSQLGIKDDSSFLIPGKKLTSVSSSARSMALKLGNGCKFACRSVDGGVRVWRVA